MRKSVYCGNIKIGGGAPISIQSMTNVDSRDERGLLAQIDRLTAAGCEIVRIAVPDMEAAEVFGRVKKQVSVPLVADIHFDYRLAIAAIEQGADKIRINPGNIGSTERVRAVVTAAKERNVPIRIGVNSGSLEKDILEKNGGVTAEGLCESVLRNAALIEDMGYDNLVLSLKSSDVRMNYEAHKLVFEKTEHPIHIGITEAGTLKRGKVKSAVGIGALLLAGIGDTMRVSLTADPVEEVVYAREILESIGIRTPQIDLISCPTCGRTRVDLQSLAAQVEERLSEIAVSRPLKVAVMGCVVNGPGEAREADFGACGGDGKGVIFAKGQVIKTVNECDIVDALIDMIKKKASV
ncbi:flavodoxin-dependent (E)-4-hydroxy-3-methylbut-2-enyl-diphosphate synthase [Anaerovoracaceae bacterium 41-7]|uniref:flavodoxin-dependent (E)-4-hydroxy-3-methylbut-2-enyl-diphosphate synthase n=1 Tax=Anaerovoracaceae TaxID=543314 RepID=UPI001379FD29|nr:MULTISPECIES: flavodoxin-dependent (E)-4-hydroxy-3-methylbut-2-enyl-diphosphate synthase [Clostridia]NCE97682.1 flavodoxin-dependent (E)-4-hydroxy-3-methylbut-2-enyl-diphosphate synthase [Emergencia sp. 1XD21-10]